jgi:hypothetical protein
MDVFFRLTLAAFLSYSFSYEFRYNGVGLLSGDWYVKLKICWFYFLNPLGECELIGEFLYEMGWFYLIYIGGDWNLIMFLTSVSIFFIGKSLQFISTLFFRRQSIVD